MKRCPSMLAVVAIITVLISVQYSKAQQGVDPAELPLLTPGTHIGTTFYGSGNVPEDTVLSDVVAEASRRGMSAFTFYVDWADLEPEPGVYNLNDLKASLIWLNGIGIQPLLNITFLDISDLTLPDDLLNAERTGLIDGMAFDDQIVIERLNNLLDEIVPLLAEHGGFLLLLGNEVDSHFEDVATSDPVAYANLISAARNYVHTILPEMAVGVTLTGTEVLDQGDIFQILRPVTDVIPFNFYPVDVWGMDWLTVMELEEIPEFIDQFMAIYGDAPVVIQELGCPSGKINNSSLDYQAQCFKVLFEALQAYPNVRYVTVFTLFDWDEATCDFVVDLFGITEEDLPGIAFDRWRGYLCTLGILNPDLSPKPAWDTFMNAINP